MPQDAPPNSVRFGRPYVYVADVAPVDQRGPALGLLRTMQHLALSLGPFFTGLLADHPGLSFQGGLFGCLALLSIATLAFRWGARDR